MIAIIDYGMGNLRSVQKAFEYLGYEAVITDSPDVIASASHVILPGVGAFEDAMKRIRETQLDQALMSAAQAGKPVLGICLGMQMMFEYSEENGHFEGLGLFPGTITRFEDRGLMIPHMGWNTLTTRPSRMSRQGMMRLVSMIRPSIPQIASACEGPPRRFFPGGTVWPSHSPGRWRR